ncbi:MAG: D-glycerate dehydrogenase [Rhodospirillaceae bacterium]|jgi:glyoxylate reductase
MNGKAKMIVTRRMPDAVEAQMQDLFDATLNYEDAPLTKDQLIAAVKAADILAPTVTDQLTAEVINEAGPQLKLIANFGVGVNHIDLGAAKAKGIAVTNTPDVLTEDTADLTMALILMVRRRLGEGERMVRAKAWPGWTPTQLMGQRVTSKKLGIIGMGRIGAAVAHRARGFDMEIHYHNRSRTDAAIEAELQATYWDDLDAMLAEVDIVSINSPHTQETANLLNRDRLSKMKPGAYLVNTARGGIVDEKALLDMIKSGAIGGAGLDVFDGEPAVNPAFLEMDEVVLLPHLGSATVEGRVDMGEKVIANALAMLAGDPLPDPI